MGKYFTKLLPGNGEIKKRTGSTVIDGEVGKCLRENDNGFDYYEEVKLFLCSRDIQVGDIVKLKTFDGYVDFPVENEGAKQATIHNGSVKVIGEVSPDATWVKEGMEFEEENVMPFIMGDNYYMGVYFRCPSSPKHFH